MVMPLASELVYNDLAGDEIKAILIERFMALLNDVPYLQKHITMPRVRMELMITLSCWADQPNPESKMIEDTVDVVVRSAVVDSSPKGNHPDEVRESHGLPVAVPVLGPFAHEDQPMPNRMTLPNGATVERTERATTVEQDFGPQENRTYFDKPGSSWAKAGGGGRAKDVRDPDFSAFGRIER